MKFKVGDKVRFKPDKIPRSFHERFGFQYGKTYIIKRENYFDRDSDEYVDLESDSSIDLQGFYAHRFMLDWPEHSITSSFARSIHVI